MNATSDERELRQSLLYAVGSICDNFTQRQQQERAPGQRTRPAPSKAALALLADLLHKETEIIATELQHFAHHANHKVIKPEDVVLLARKDPAMMRSLQKYHREQLGATGAKKRRRGGGDD